MTIDTDLRAAIAAADDASTGIYDILEDCFDSTRSEYRSARALIETAKGLLKSAQQHLERQA